MRTDSRAREGGGTIFETEQVCMGDSEKDRRAVAREASKERERKNQTLEREKSDE